MATASSESINDLLECSICLDNLQRPKLLPCAHRFCQDCLLNEVRRSATGGSKKSFPCPLCKRVTHLKGVSLEESVDALETDRLARDLLERIGSDGPKNVPDDVPLHVPHDVDVCEQHGQKLKMVCYTCMVVGCKKCQRSSHKKCPLRKSYHIEKTYVRRDLQDTLVKVQRLLQTDKLTFWNKIKNIFQQQVDESNQLIENTVDRQKGRIQTKMLQVHKYYELFGGKVLSKRLEKEREEMNRSYELHRDELFDNNRELLAQESSSTDRLEVNELIGISDSIQRLLEMPNSEMIIEGYELLDDYMEYIIDANAIMDGNYVESFSLKDLITRPEQVHLPRDFEDSLDDKIECIEYHGYEERISLEYQRTLSKKYGSMVFKRPKSGFVFPKPTCSSRNIFIFCLILICLFNLAYVIDVYV